MTVAQPDRALKRARAGDSSMSLALVECFAVNERMNQIVLDILDPAAWKARLPGTRSRTIAAVFTHVHNVRRKWIRLSAPDLELPAALDRSKCTQAEARAALEQSGALCVQMISAALAGRSKADAVFVRDGWAKPWTPGAAMVAYMVTHERTIGGRSACSPISSGIPWPPAPAAECGPGKGYGKSADSRRRADPKG